MPSRMLPGTLIPLCLAAAPADAQVRREPETERQSSESESNPAGAFYPSEATGDRSPANRYSSSRWAEDWRDMADPANRDDPIDRLKFLPLDDDGAIYLTLSGEARLRVDAAGNPGLREGPHQRRDILRLVGGADLHLGRTVRVYGEVAHGGIDGRNIGTPSGALRNDLVLQQAFVEVADRVGDVSVGARVGRQEFEDGPNLLLTSRDNRTIRFTLDGVRLWARTSKVRATLFDLHDVALGQGGLGDDPTDDRVRFSGVTAGIVLPRDLFGGSKLYLDPFAWRERQDERRWGDSLGRERRTYVGAQFWGEAGPVEIDWTINHQGGRFDGRPIDGWQAFIAQSVAIGSSGAAPRVGVRFDYASGGGGTAAEGTLKATRTPYGNNIHFSYGTFLTATNLVALAPNVSFRPVPDVVVTLEHQLTWRPSESDAVYTPSSAYAGTEAVPGHRVAQVSRAQIQWTLTPRLSLTTRLEYLKAQAALTRAGYTDSAFAAGFLSFRF